jgi:hypothetical protein
MSVRRETKSPLKGRPLRNPGQSVQEQGDELRDDRILQPVLLALVLTIMAGMEWWRYYFSVPPAPWLYSAIALGAMAYAAWQWRRTMPQIRQLRQARDGERAVGQFLEKLRVSGYEVFHDIVAQGFNVDHVLIGPAGVFSVETKTFSKPVRGETKVSFDGASVLVGGFSPDRDPLVQAKAQAAWLGKLLEESTGKTFTVRPVILFPGWFVEQSGRSSKDIWVLNPKALPSFIEHEPTVLSDSDIKLASFHLSRFMRSITPS